jgi:hypothetical protein
MDEVKKAELANDALNNIANKNNLVNNNYGGNKGSNNGFNNTSNNFGNNNYGNNTGGYNNTNNTTQGNSVVSDFYFENKNTIEIGKQKYVYRVRCNLWDKGMDIHVALEHLRDIQNTVPTTNTTRVHTPSLISIYDAYEFYCKFYSTPNSNSNMKTKNFLVSKSYFEKFILENYSDNISENGILTFI